MLDTKTAKIITTDNMKISKLITQLKQKQEQFGDIICEAFSQAGEYRKIEDIVQVNVNTSKQPIYRIYLAA